MKEEGKSKEERRKEEEERKGREVRFEEGQCSVL